MCSSRLPTSEPQSFYFPNDYPRMPGWSKGMQIILIEHGLWPEKGLPAQCQDFKCPPGHTDWSCQRILFLQPDFAEQHSQLQELIEGCGHLCDFYPKYHCKLNFIEQYWGAAKAQYRVLPQAKTVCNMEKTIKECLDSVPLVQIQRFVSVFLSLFCLITQLISYLRFTNQAACFITGYHEGLSGAQAAWANRKYHRHRMLPPESILEAKSAINT